MFPFFAALALGSGQQIEEYQGSPLLKWLARHQSDDGSWRAQLSCGCGSARAAPVAKAELSAEDRSRVARLVRELAAEEYGTRQRATEALVQMGTRIVAALEDELRETTDAEARDRIRQVQAAFVRPGKTFFLTGLALNAFLVHGYTHLSKDTYDGICTGQVVKRALQF